MISLGYSSDHEVKQIWSNSCVGVEENNHDRRREILHNVEVGNENNEEAGNVYEIDPFPAPLLSYQMASSYSPQQTQQSTPGQEEPDHPCDVWPLQHHQVLQIG